MKKIIISLLTLIILLSCSRNYEKLTVDDWLKLSGLGKYRLEKEDHDLIVSKAKDEGLVRLYSNSSRVFKIARAFEDKYGIKVEPFDIDSNEVINRIIREVESSVHFCDVILTNDAVYYINELLNNGLCYNYFPDSALPYLNYDREKEKTLIHRYSARVLIYNDSRFSSEPITSWWELTEKKWKNKIYIPDPLARPYFNLFSLFIKNHEIMADEYKRIYGKEISPGDFENAGYKFINDLFSNNIRIAPSTSDILNIVGLKNTDNLGLVAYSKMRHRNKNDLKFNAIKNIKPAAGIRLNTLLAIPVFAPHPNAAKLLIEYMLFEGFEPYNVTGNWRSLTISDHNEKENNLFAMKLWNGDDQWVYENRKKVSEYLLSYFEKQNK